MATAAADDKNDDEIEFVVVETPPQDDQTDDNSQPGDTDEEEDDERLSTSQDDLDDEVKTSENRKRRQERKERQQRAREAQERELRMLRQQINELKAAQGQQASAALDERQRQLDAQYREAQDQAKQAETIRAKAIEAGNGEDAIAAERIQRAAEERAAAVARDYHQIEQSKKAPPPTATEVQRHANDWLAQNDWYNPKGGDPESDLVNRIDAEMTNAGWDPSQRGYWEELTHRVTEGLGAQRDSTGGNTQQPSGRRSPPQANGRGEHAPTSTRREIYVTPERKQAMQDAGVWEDPVARNRMLKAYSEYDRQNTAR